MWKKHISTEIFTYVIVGFLMVILLLCGVFLNYQKDAVQEKINTSIMGILNQTSNSIKEKMNQTEAFARYMKLNTTLIDILKGEPNYDDSVIVDKLITDMGNSQMWSDKYITVVGNGGHLYMNWENAGNIQHSQGVKDLSTRLHDENDILAKIPFQRMVGYNNLDPYDKNKKLIGTSTLIRENTYAGEKVGILTVGIPTKAIADIMEENRIFEESEVHILDQDSRILLSTNPEIIGTIFDTGDTAITWEEYTAASCMVKREQGNMMVFYQALNSEWVQAISIPYHSYTKEIRVMITAFIGVAIIAIFLALMISLLISYSISKPIKELEQSIDRINSGDLKNRVRVTRKDDIGRLGLHFNVMANNLENLIAEKIEDQKRTSELVIANKTAELKMLHAQINPHFLFNTLNSIRCLAMINKADYLVHMLESLGAILENSIMKGQDNTSIEHEISLVKKYIELQQMRYGKRLKAEFMVSEEIYKNEIPKFMLQPLVENAITHGISSKIEGGTVTIRGGRQGNFVRIEVEDDGIGVEESRARSQTDPEALEKHTSGHGIGISNIRERLQLIYGNECDLSIQCGQHGMGTLAVLTFPVNVFKEERNA